MDTKKKKNILRRALDKVRDTAMNFLGGTDSLYKSSYLQHIKKIPQVNITNKDIKSVDVNASDFKLYIDKIKKEEKARKKKRSSFGL